MRENLIEIIYTSFNGIMKFNIKNKHDVRELFENMSNDKYFVLCDDEFKTLNDKEMFIFLKTKEAENIIFYVENAINSFDVYCVIVEIYSMRLANFDYNEIVEYVLQKYKTTTSII